MKFIPASKRNYSEIYQQKHITFSFCNKTKEGKEIVLTQMFHWVQCRDFLSDVLFAEETKEKIDKYSFIYDPAKQKIDRDKTRLLVKFKFDKDVKNFLTNIHILHDIEASNRYGLTKFTLVKNKIFLIEGSKMWQNTTFSLSLYTFLLKVLGYEFEKASAFSVVNWLKEIKEKATNEGQYARQFISEFEEILYTKLKQLFSKPTTVHGYEPNYSYVTYVHDNGGVLSLFKTSAAMYDSINNNIYYQRLTKLLG